jgi:hypothetical protein
MPRTKTFKRLIEIFSSQMQDRFREKAMWGLEGWSDKTKINRSALIIRIISNALTGDWVNVANLAAMAWNLKL